MFQMSRTQHQHLRKNWDNWIRVVRAFESRQKMRISPGRYTAIYRQLLNTCDAPSADDVAGSQSEARLHKKIKTLVTPWVSLETIRHADRAILRDLLSQCGEVEGVMHPHVVRVPRWVWLIAVSIVLFALIGVVIYFNLDSSGDTTLQEQAAMVIERIQREVHLMTRRMNTTHFLAIVAIVVLLFGVWISYGTKAS